MLVRLFAQGVLVVTGRQVDLCIIVFKFFLQPQLEVSLDKGAEHLRIDRPKSRMTLWKRIDGPVLVPFGFLKRPLQRLVSRKPLPPALLNSAHQPLLPQFGSTAGLGMLPHQLLQSWLVTFQFRIELILPANNTVIHTHLAGDKFRDALNPGSEDLGVLGCFGGERGVFERLTQGENGRTERVEFVRKLVRVSVLVVARFIRNLQVTDILGSEGVQQRDDCHMALQAAELGLYETIRRLGQRALFGILDLEQIQKLSFRRDQQGQRILPRAHLDEQPAYDPGRIVLAKRTPDRRMPSERRNDIQNAILKLFNPREVIELAAVVNRNSHTDNYFPARAAAAFEVDRKRLFSVPVCFKSDKRIVASLPQTVYHEPSQRSRSMKANDLHRLILLLGYLCSTAGWPDTGAAQTSDPPPNIVLLYADDMGWGDLACQNPDSRIPTPNLDRLAAEGTRFTDAHSSSGICTPSRYALLLGRYHWRKFHGIVNSFDQPVLDDERTTLAELLRSRGYRTACIGKWHLGWDWKAIQRDANPKADPKRGFPPDAFDWTRPIPGGPLAHGFDDYFGDDVPNFPPYTWFENDRLLAPPTEPLKTTLKTAEGSFETRPGPAVANWDFYAVMPTLTDKAVEWIGQQSVERPFFLYFPFTSPHAPIVPAAEFTGKSNAGGYGDFVAQTDAAVGRVLAALEAGGHSGRTLVIFTADNGPETYAYERVRRFEHRSMGPLRGLKRDLWEGGHRVPMIMRWPGQIPARKVSDGLLSQIDLYATIAELAGCEVPLSNAEDSLDQSGLLSGESGSARSELVHNTNPNGYAIRHGDWVLIDAPSGGVSKVPEWYNQANQYLPRGQPGELYNLREDLAQQHNLFAQHPDKVAELKRRLEEVRRGRAPQ